MFRCQFCGGLSAPGELLRTIVTEWRLKTYPSRELPPEIGSNVRRWSKGGEGYEAAVTKRSCAACDKKNVSVPRKENTNVPALQAA